MKTPQTFSKILNKPNFNFLDIENLLFNNINPEIISYPFRPFLPYSCTLEIPPSIDPQNFKALLKYVKKINDVNVTAEYVSNLPFSLFDYLFMTFLQNVKDWQTYYLENLLEFSESMISITNWNTFKHTSYKNFFSLPIKNFQSLWINVMVSKDREFWAKFATDIKEDLLPWLDKELWIKINNADTNKRVNVDYEKQRKQMIEGELEDFEEIIIDEDLDIIK